MLTNKIRCPVSFPLSIFQNGFRLFYEANSLKVVPKHTALHGLHLKYGGKMINFGGYMLPVQYSDQSIISSHLHTRRYASIFDVSHMLQTYMGGKDAISCLESLCTADIKKMSNCTGALTVFTNSDGGILDDLLVFKVNEEMLYVVSNANTRIQNMNIMKCAGNKFLAKGKDVNIEFLSTETQSLIAIQGPEAITTLSPLLSIPKALERLYFMNTTVCEIAGVPDCRITRCGYTGEDGVEVSVSSNHVQYIIESLLAANPSLRLAGLGARDSLRLEAGLCLYGTDINSETTPVEADLAWLLARRRRLESNFPGAKKILSQLQSGANQVLRRRVGLIMGGKKQLPPARAGVCIYYQDKKVGHITSGCPSPSLGRNIAMGYIEGNFKRSETSVQLKIRNIFYEATITRMPFVRTKYYINLGE